MDEEVIELKRKSESEYVFNSRKDLKRFFDDLENGKWITVTYVNGDIRMSELVSPIESSRIHDGAVRLLAEEQVVEKVKK
jgi:hypothetical protein